MPAMTAIEAAELFEYLDHPFYVFRNKVRRMPVYSIMIISTIYRAIFILGHEVPALLLICLLTYLLTNLLLVYAALMRRCYSLLQQESGEVNVLYKRLSGGVGHIQPDVDGEVEIPTD